MKMLLKQISMWTVLVLVTQGAWGQISRVQGGRALDSNYRIGSGQVNSTAPRRTTFGSQMYITGQVSGLGAFRGRTGYSAANQLRMTIPSAALSDFRRQSVGLSDVLSGNTYRPTQYLDPSTTALGVNAISSGQTATGTNVPKSTILARKAIAEAMSDFRLGVRSGGAITYNIQPAIMVDLSTPRIVNRHGFSGVSNTTGAFGASELAVFTVSRPSQRSAVDEELQRLSEDDHTRIDASARDRIVPIAGDGNPDLTRGALGNTGIAGKGTVESDVFLSLVYLLQQQHLDSLNKVADSEPESGDPKIKLKPLGARPGSIELIEQGLRGELVFNTLAGRGPDAFNTAMRKGENHLKEGHFYDAAEQYRVAKELAPGNPTTRLGLAVALFGAGESLGAAFQLRQAMEMFPPIMATRLNVVRKIPTKKLKARLDQIHDRIKGRKGTNVDPQLVMLATYMHRSSGENYIAELCAVKLKGSAGDDKLYKAYATYVLTGKRPAEMQSTTRPSGK
ncbi:MAG: hypothetical protein GY794_09855 [bacterium]|nr:hypothetical protein [bacterium]